MHLTKYRVFKKNLNLVVCLISKNIVSSNVLIIFFCDIYICVCVCNLGVMYTSTTLKSNELQISSLLNVLYPAKSISYYPSFHQLNGALITEYETHRNEGNSSEQTTHLSYLMLHLMLFFPWVANASFGNSICEPTSSITHLELAADYQPL